MGLTPPPKVEKLQTVLRAKAKEQPQARFHQLHDKIYRSDVVAFAYERCRANGGAPGVDGQSFEMIESQGREAWLGELAEKLRTRTYRPDAVRRVWIPKGDGKRRPLGIPTVMDRVAQMAFVLVVEPIFDEDLQPEQHAYRTGRDAHGAVQEVQAWLDRGFTEVVDADLSGYFDSIPHHELMQCLSRRIVDRHVLHLVKMWLEAARRRSRRRTRRAGRSGRPATRTKGEARRKAEWHRRCWRICTCAGSSWAGRRWKTLGHAERLEARIVNYADDFVICCKRDRAEKAMAAMRKMMDRLKLTVNEKKTRRCQAWTEPFRFLGFEFGVQISWKTGRRYLAPSPSKSKVQAICEKIGTVTSRRTTWRDEGATVAILNRLLLGWGNYFRLGYVTGAWQTVQQHACRGLRRWLQRKHGRKGGPSNPPDLRLYEDYGLTNVVRTIRRKSLWANAR